MKPPGYPLLPGVVVKFSKLELPSYEVCSGSDEEGEEEANLQVVCLLPLGTLVSVLDEKLRFFDAKRVRQSVRRARRRRRARGITSEKLEEGIAMASIFEGDKVKHSVIVEDIKHLLISGKNDGDAGGVGTIPEKLHTSEITPKGLPLSSAYGSESS